MIEIIQNGKIKREHSCRYCGCIFRFDAEDVTKVVEFHKGDSIISGSFKLNCPYCKNSIDLDNDFTQSELQEMKEETIDYKNSEIEQQEVESDRL